jgi:hypothetical protein
VTPSDPATRQRRGSRVFCEARKRLSAFVLSLVCGLVVPLSPLPAELWVRGRIDPVSWFAVGVTYVAGIGLVSRNQAVLILLLVAAAALAFIYGVDMKSGLDWDLAHPGGKLPPLDALGAQLAIALASLMYVLERIGRHLVDDRPFPEP